MNPCSGTTSTASVNSLKNRTPVDLVDILHLRCLLIFLLFLCNVCPCPDGELYWQPMPTSPSDPYWYRASSTEVELTSYVLQALLAAPAVDFVGASQIVKWLSKQQNAFGGFSSTQVIR